MKEEGQRSKDRSKDRERALLSGLPFWKPKGKEAPA